MESRKVTCPLVPEGSIEDQVPDEDDFPDFSDLAEIYHSSSPSRSARVAQLKIASTTTRSGDEQDAREEQREACVSLVGIKRFDRPDSADTFHFGVFPVQKARPPPQLAVRAAHQTSVDESGIAERSESDGSGRARSPHDQGLTSSGMPLSDRPLPKFGDTSSTSTSATTNSDAARHTHATSNTSRCSSELHRESSQSDSRSEDHHNSSTLQTQAPSPERYVEPDSHPDGLDDPMVVDEQLLSQGIHTNDESAASQVERRSPLDDAVAGEQLQSSQPSCHGLQNPRLNEHFRVSKQRPVKRPRLELREAANCAELPTTSAEGPSDEDLLLLLMHRGRQREVGFRREAAKFQHLQTYISELEAENNDLSSGCQEAKVQLLVAEKKNANQKDDLEDFKNKYSKLREWAKQMNVEFASLRQQKQTLDIGLCAARTESTAIRGSMSNLTGVCERASTQNEQHTCHLHESRNSILDLQTQIAAQKVTITANESELLRERTERKRLEAYVGRLLTIQHSVGMQMAAKYQILMDELRTVRESIQFANNDQALLTVSKRLVEAFEEYRGRSQVVKHKDVQQVKDILTGLSKQMKGLQSDSYTVRDIVSRNGNSESTADAFQSIKQMIEALRLERDDTSSLQLTNMMLQEHMTSLGALQQLWEREREVASHRIIQLEQREEETNNERKASISNCEGVIKQLRVDLDRRFDVVMSKCESSIQVFTECGNKLSSIEHENGRLTQELELAEEWSVMELAEAQAMYAEENRRLRDEMALQSVEYSDCIQNHASIIQHQASVHTNIVIQVVAHTAKMRNLEQALCCEQERLIASKEETNALTLQRKHLEDVLQQTQSEVSRLEEVLTSKSQQIDDISVALKKVADSESMVLQLKNEHQQKDNRICALQSRLTDLTSCQEQLRDSKLKANQLEERNDVLQNEVKRLQPYENTVEELQRRIYGLDNQMADVQRTLNATKVQAAFVTDLRQENQEQSEELASLKKRLLDVQRENDKLEELETDREQLSCQVQVLSNDLRATRAEVERLDNIDATLTKKDEAILKLEQQVAQYRTIVHQLQLLQTDVDKEEAPSQGDPRTQSSSSNVGTVIPLPLKQADGNLSLEGIVSSNVNISLRSCSLPANQSSVEVAASTTEFYDGEYVTHVQQSSASAHGIDVIDPKLTIICCEPTQNFSKELPLAVSQKSRIEDSQIEVPPLPEIRDIEFDHQEPSSSSLSDLTELTDFNLHDLESRNSAEQHQPDNGTRNLYDLPHSSPGSSHKHKIVRRTSTSSQESMLLQNTPKYRPTRQGPSKFKSTNPETRSLSNACSSLPNLSRREHRTGDRRNELERQVTPNASLQPSADEIESPAGFIHQRYQPNSAAKRLHTEMAAPVSIASKRLKRSSRVLSDRISTVSSRKTGRKACSIPSQARSMPAGSHSSERGIPPSTDALRSSVKQPKAKSVRKLSQQDKYTARFSESC